jgi:adenylate kinase
LPRSPEFQSRIGITGSPGTGKKSIGVELARLTGLDLLLINDFAIRKKFGIFEEGEFIVDLNKLGRTIDTRNKIVCGHLLPYLIPRSKIDFVAVLRCSPATLRKRYLKREYNESKISENLEAEMIGVIAAKSLQVYGLRKLAEFDTSRSNPASVARRILASIRGKTARQFGKIDWLASQYSSHEVLRYSKSHSKTIKDNYV